MANVIIGVNMKKIIEKLHDYLITRRIRRLIREGSYSDYVWYLDKFRR